MAVAKLNYEFGADLSKLDLSINEIDKLLKNLKNQAKSTAKDGLAPLNAEIAKLVQEKQRLQNIGLPTNLPSSTKKSTIALNDLSRVVQDLPFGFIGIQNNIPALVQSFGGLTAAEGGLRAGLANLGKSLIGPAGLLFAFSAVTSAVTFAIQKYGSLGAAYDAIFKDKKITESQKKIIDNIAEESTMVFTLYGLYTNLNGNRKLQEETIAKLNKISPEYFGNLDKEKTKLDQLNIATDKYIKSLLGKIFVETQQAQVTEILKKYGAELSKVVENEINLSNQRDKDKNKLKNQVELFDRLSKSQQKLSDIPISITPVITKITTTEDLIKGLSDRLKKEITTLFGASSKFADVLNLNEIFGNKEEETKTSTDKIDKTIDDSNKRQEAAFKVLQQAYISTLTDREQELYKIQDEYEQKRGDLLRANISDFALIEEEKLIAIRKVVEKYDKISLDEFEKQKDAELKIAKEQAKQIEDLFKNDTLNFQPKINIDYSKLGFSQEILDQLNQGALIGDAIKNVENQTLSVGKAIYSNIINPLNEVFDIVLSKGEKSWENFTKSVVESLKKLYAKLVAAAAIAAILSLASGGTATPGGVGFFKAFGSILGVNLGGKVANPGFGGVQPGGMQMAGSVNMVLRAQDLVGSLNRTNSQFSRIG